MPAGAGRGHDRWAEPRAVRRASATRLVFVLTVAGVMLAGAALHRAAAQAPGDGGAGHGSEADTRDEAAAERLRESQVRWFTRLLSERDLAPEMRQMLIEDFAAQSPVTRHHLIRRYRAGDG